MALNVDGAQQLEFDVWTVQGEEKHFAFLKDNFCFSTVSGLFSFGCVIRFLGKRLKWRPSSFDARRRHFMFLFPLFWRWNWWKGPSICLERLLFQLKEFRSFWSQKKWHAQSKWIKFDFNSLEYSNESNIQVPCSWKGADSRDLLEIFEVGRWRGGKGVWRFSPKTRRSSEKK